MDKLISDIISLVPPETVKTMATAIFLTCCVSAIGLIMSVCIFALNIAELPSRICPRQKEDKVSSTQLWPKRLMFWKKEVKEGQS